MKMSNNYGEKVAALSLTNNESKKILTDFLKVLQFDDASARRQRSDDRLEPIREQNQNFQDGYVPNSCMTGDK